MMSVPVGRKDVCVVRTLLRYLVSYYSLCKLAEVTVSTEATAVLEEAHCKATSFLNYEGKLCHSECRRDE